MLYGGTNDIIGEYVSFTKVYDAQRKKYGRTKEAITETIRICKDTDILKKYLEDRESEVVRMMMSIGNKEQIMRAYTNTIMEQGMEQGKLAQLVELVKDGLIGITDASKRANMTEQEFQLLLDK